MAFIGDSIYIGGDWYVGSWYAGASYSDSNYLGLGAEDIWVYYDENDNVITELDYGNILPDNTSGQIIKAKYRGFAPIKILGFYLTDINESFYDGSMSPVVDKETLITWADQFTGTDVPPGTPGLEVQFDDFTTGLPVITQAKSGEGDLAATPIEYTGHENGIVSRDDTITLTLRLTAPSDTERQILQAAKLHFGLDISYIEIPENLVSVLVGGSC